VIDFDELNDLVNEVFFSGKYAGAPVYLSLEEDEREQLASELGVAADEVDSYVGYVVASTLEFDVANIYRRPPATTSSMAASKHEHCPTVFRSLVGANTGRGAHEERGELLCK
jgi:hypothetical protein